MINLVLCADDFGRSAAIDDAILELGEVGRLTAATVMIREPNLWRSAYALKRMTGMEIGLHLVLTDDVSATSKAASSGAFMACHIDVLTRHALSRRLPLEAIADEVAAQFEAFRLIFGFPPHFVDGHQHCHMLPGIRAIVLRIAAEKAPGCWIRSCEQPVRAIARRGGDVGRALRSSVLSHGMRAAAESVGLRVNDGFAGLYDLRNPLGYAERFGRFLNGVIGPNHLVICHPARGGDRSDPLGPARFAEYNFLRHASIARIVADRGLSLGIFQ